MRDLSVIVCTHNRYDVLTEALASIEAQSLSRRSYELIVVDNSTDLKAQDAYYAGFDVECEHRIIREREPGLSRARNIGVRAASGRIVAFMDDDARAAPDWASELVGAFARHPEAGVVGGPVQPIWTSPRPSWLHKWLEGYLTIVDRGEEERALAPHEWLAGTNIAFLRAPLLETGLFGERLGRIGRLLLSNEELALTDELRARGHSAVYAPRALVRHMVHADRLNPEWMRRRVFWQAISDVFAGADVGDFDANMGRILEFQAKASPRLRGLPGLFRDYDDPDTFLGGLEALAALARLMATDARDWRAYLPADR